MTNVKRVFIVDGKPFFPVGANYFSTEANGWDFALLTAFG